jgi:TRAP-type mannitol/chloroaromatic compound transport system permease small subunit
MVKAADARTGPGFQWLRRLISMSGRSIAWLTLAMVLLTFVIVILRYGFNLGWIWLQESVTYMHAAVFMVAAAWTLQQDEHVRVDILYNRMSPKKRCLVDLAGTLLFLVPLCLFILVTALPYVSNSWKLMESSREAGGLPALFLLKTFILVLPALLLGQAFLGVADAIQTLRKPAESQS